MPPPAIDPSTRYRRVPPPPYAAHGSGGYLLSASIRSARRRQAGGNPGEVVPNQRRTLTTGSVSMSREVAST